ncbi:MAG: metallophosphoesterase [Clostridiales bacterium]|nr:metallophosphoesterase [Clostridiales bacterium]
MRYALIADIHGNLPAFNAVLSDAKNQNIDKYIFLGDYITSLPYPNQVVNLIKNISCKYVIRGNSEDYLSNLEKHDQNTWNDIQFHSLYWCYRALSKENLDYLKKLPVEKKIKDEHADIYAFHSSNHYFKNTSINDISIRKFRESVEKHTYSPDEYINILTNNLNDDLDLKNYLSTLPDGIYMYGHNHMQMHVQFDNKLIINPGSCGVPLDFKKSAAYTLLETKKNKWHVEELRIPYDLEGTIRKFKETDLYKYARVWSDIMIRHLETGSTHDGYFLRFIEKYAEKPYTQEVWEKAYELWSEQQCS